MPDKRENRQINNSDDQHTKEHRRADLFARGDNRVQPFVGCQASPELVLFCAELSNDVFDDDDSAVDDEPKIDSPKTHQVPRNSEPRHAGNREKKGQWNCSCDDERGAPVPKKEKQHRDDK